MIVSELGHIYCTSCFRKCSV